MSAQAIPSVTIEVPIVAVPRTIELTDGDVYVFREGRLWSCGSLNCILGHLDIVPEYHHLGASAIRDHFNGSWAGEGSDRHAYVVQS